MKRREKPTTPPKTEPAHITEAKRAFEAAVPRRRHLRDVPAADRATAPLRTAVGA